MNLNTERNIQTIGNTPRIKPTERQTLGVVQNTNQVHFQPVKILSKVLSKSNLYLGYVA